MALSPLVAADDIPPSARLKKQKIVANQGGCPNSFAGLLGPRDHREPGLGDGFSHRKSKKVR
jgi:hypothetical protein